MMNSGLLIFRTICEDNSLRNFIMKMRNFYNDLWKSPYCIALTFKNA